MTCDTSSLAGSQTPSFVMKHTAAGARAATESDYRGVFQTTALIVGEHDTITPKEDTVQMYVLPSLPICVFVYASNCGTLNRGMEGYCTTAWLPALVAAMLAFPVHTHTRTRIHTRTHAHAHPPTLTHTRARTHIHVILLDVIFLQRYHCMPKAHGPYIIPSAAHAVFAEKNELVNALMTSFLVKKCGIKELTVEVRESAHQSTDTQCCVCSRGHPLTSAPLLLAGTAHPAIAPLQRDVRFYADRFATATCWCATSSGADWR